MRPRNSKLPRYYPVFLSLEGKTCVVVGGGQVAHRKVLTLLSCGAKVRVVALELVKPLQRAAERGEVEYVAKEYHSSALKGAVLVIGATNDPEVNRRVSADARRRRMQVNIVDAPELCTFIVPSIVRRGPVSVAVGTSGASPALARKLRLELEKAVGPEYGELASLLGQLRPHAYALVKGAARRKRFWQLAVESEALDLLRRGERRRALETLRKCIYSQSAQITRRRR
jgi:siroheme synthase-like protein